MRRSPSGVLLTLLAALGLVSSASAAPTVDRVVNAGGQVLAFRLIDSSNTVNDVFLDKALGADRLEFFSVTGGDITLTAGAQGVGCTQPSAVSVSCPRVVAGREMRMEVFAGPLDDTVSVGSQVPVGVDLYGEGGADFLTGGNGDDFIEPGPGLDVPKGGAGRDRISFDDGRATGVAFNLSPGGTLVDGGEDDEGFEDVQGTNFSDTIVGDEGPNRIDGLGAGDVLDGFSGDDVLDGGLGEGDDLYGEAGDDVFIDGGGTTTIDGGPNDDTMSYEDESVGRTFNMSTATLPDVATFTAIEGVRGTSGNDTFLGAPFPNQIFRYEGGPGNDELRGVDLNAEIFLGGDGADTLRGGLGTDSYTGGAGIDTLAFDEASRTGAVTQSLVPGAPSEDLLKDPIENVIGGPGSDTLTGNAETNVIDGAAGNDTIDGAGGADTLIGGAQNDTVTGGAGTDVFLLGEGDDVFAAKESEADTVDCGNGTDVGTFDAVDTLIACEPVPDPAPTTPTTPVTTTPAATTPAPVVPAPLPRIGATAKGSFTVAGSVTRVKTLTVLGLPAGGQAVVGCTPPSKDRKKKGKAAPCPFASRTITAKRSRAQLKLAPLFAGRKLTVGTVITIKLSAPQTFGKVATFVVRKGKKPSAVVA